MKLSVRFVSILLFCLLSTQVYAAVTQTIGAGSAVSVADRTATFDSVITGTDLSTYTEAGLDITTSGLAFVGFDAFNEGANAFQLFYSSGGNSDWTSIKASDNLPIFAIEAKLGDGYSNAITIVYISWETWSSGVMADSGSFTTDKGNVGGWSDPLGFDEIRIAAFNAPDGVLGTFQALALDDVMVALSDVVVADLSISKTDSVDPVTAGTPLTYTIRVDNIGTELAADVVATDTLPAGVTLVSTSGCAEDPTGVPGCSLGSIAAGAFAEYTITVDVDPATLGTITNNASVTTSSPENDVTNNTVTEDTLVSAEADLSITQVVSGSNQTFVYTIEVSNAGPSDATNVLVNDILPSIAVFQSTSGCLNDPAGVPDCQLGTIGVGGSASYTITVTLPITDGTVTNSVSVSSDAFDPDADNSSSDLTTGLRAISVPTLGGLGMALLILLLGSVGWVSTRRT